MSSVSTTASMNSLPAVPGLSGAGSPSPFASTGGARSVAEETALLLRSPVIELPAAHPGKSSFGDVFTHKLGIWGTRMGAGELFDHAFEAMGKRGFDPVMMEQNATAVLNENPQLARQIAKTYPYGYEGLFSLRGAQDVTTAYLKYPKQYFKLLKYNFEPHIKAYAPKQLIQSLSNGDRFFKFGFKDYVTKTLWGRNVEALRPSNFIHADAKGLAKLSGAGISQAFGLGLFSWDIARTAKTAFDNARHEDGATKTSIATETGKEFAKQVTKSLITWEIAGAGLAVGRKVLPGVNIGNHHLPLGGMVVGAVAATAANKLLERISPKARE
ncbi:MAG: hypothetical protein AB7P76_05575 [Candidatus Melainabacteria bacterium]